MSGPSDLFDLCAEYLEACKAGVASTPGGAIDRAYVAPGPPAWDCCPQLTVHAGGPQEADTLPLQPPLGPGERPDVQGSVHLVNMTATVLRCVPEPEDQGQTVILPSAAALQAAAENTLADVWAIWATVRGLFRAGVLFASDAGRRELFFDPAVPVRPAGGCAGWELQIRVALGGYTVTP